MPLLGPHPGEIAVRKLLHVPSSDITANPQAPGLPGRYAARAGVSPLVAVGTLDGEGRPWTSLWADGGNRGFIAPRGQNLLGIDPSDNEAYDPVVQALREEEESPEIVSGKEIHRVREKMVGGLSIDLETRDRVKLGGSMVARVDKEWFMHVTESLGNCPKYLNRRTIVPAEGKPAPDEMELPLSEDALGLIAKADMFFLSSTDGSTMDTNHRGGPAGFVRVERNDKAVSLVYPEYSGNRLYQTLGNLNVIPLVGIVIPDFETSDVLYLTGTSTILTGQEASSVLSRSQVAVRINVTEAHFVRSGLPFRGVQVDPSPYNPPVRRLVSEQDGPIPEARRATATLLKRESLTPSISRLTFSLDEKMTWRPGQHVTLDFSEELDHGWSHMRDDDPQSLNDDFVRTFTVSSPPGEGREFQITARRNGPATGLLWRHNVRVPLELPVMGFGGKESFMMPKEGAVFVAGGVGITPFLAQADGNRGKLLWSLRGEDVELAKDVFGRTDGLASRTTIYLTGDGKSSSEKGVEELRDMGATVLNRRVEKADLEVLKGKDLGFFLCASPGLLKRLNEWLDGENVVWEDFGY